MEKPQGETPKEKLGRLMKQYKTTSSEVVKKNLKNIINKLKKDMKDVEKDVEDVVEDKPKAKPKKRATKKATATKKKPSKADYDKAKKDLNNKAGKTYEECKEIIKEYEAKRKKSQAGKEKAKKRTTTLKNQGKLTPQGKKKPEVVIEEAGEKVVERVEESIKEIKKTATPKPSKGSKPSKTTTTKVADKPKVKAKVKEVVKEQMDEIADMVKQIVAVVNKTMNDKALAKQQLIKLRDKLTAEINKMEYGGLTDGATQNMNVTQSQMSAESVNPQMYAKGGEVITDYEYFRGKDHEEFTNYIFDRISLDDRREIRKEWNEKERVSRAKGERGVEWKQYLLDSVNKNKMAHGGYTNDRYIEKRYSILSKTPKDPRNPEILFQTDNWNNIKSIVAEMNLSEDDVFVTDNQEDREVYPFYAKGGIVKRKIGGMTTKLERFRDDAVKDYNNYKYYYKTSDGKWDDLTNTEWKKKVFNAYMSQMGYAKGGMTQGYNDRMDESLGMRHRGHHSQTHKDRRDEAKGMNKGMGNRAYQSVGTMDNMFEDGGRTLDVPNLNDGDFVPTYKKGGKPDWIQKVVDSPKFDKGAFTRKAKNRGMTTTELMNDVLSNPNEYTLKTRRQAQFMKNVSR